MNIPHTCANSDIAASWDRAFAIKMGFGKSETFEDFAGCYSAICVPVI
jgi:hypothetical protein